VLAGRRLLICLFWVALFLTFGAIRSFAQNPPDSPASPTVQGGGSVGSSPESAQPLGAVPPVYDIKIVRTYPHDPSAFTQGLIFANGFLFESTGLVGRSTLRKVELETGKVFRSSTVPGVHFAEGLTRWGDKLIQLTWQSGVGFVYDMRSFAKLSEFRYPTEGWGLTNDNKSLIMSDGTAVLRFLDPAGFAVTKQIEVRDRGRPITNINELEYIKGEIYANIWLKDIVARISPQTGRVLGWINMRKLRRAFRPGLEVDALNGIAYDPIKDRIFVTGKLWPKLFQIELKPSKRLEIDSETDEDEEDE
jgi:glutamine cyclotransferase